MRLKIAEAIAPNWRDVAKLTGLNHAQITSIENPGSGKTPGQCLDEVLMMWKNSSESDYPYNWNGLLDLLQDVECSVLAEDLKEALSSQQNTACKSILQPNLDIIIKGKYPSKAKVL